MQLIWLRLLRSRLRVRQLPTRAAHPPSLSPCACRCRPCSSISAPLALLAERAAASCHTGRRKHTGFGYALAAAWVKRSRSTNEAALPVALVLLCSLLQPGWHARCPVAHTIAHHLLTTNLLVAKGGSCSRCSHGWPVSLQLAMAGAARAPCYCCSCSPPRAQVCQRYQRDLPLST